MMSLWRMVVVKERTGMMLKWTFRKKKLVKVQEWLACDDV